MKYVFLFCAMLAFTFGNVIERDKSSDQNNLQTSRDDLKVFNFEELQDYLKSKDTNKTYVVNFWATWCAPCVKELPYFEQLNSKYAEADIEVVLVSLDFPKHIDTKLKPFLKKHILQSEVVLLDDVDSNTWIPKVDKGWSGAIPATVIYNHNKRQFYERSFTYEELEAEVKQFLK